MEKDERLIRVEKTEGVKYTEEGMGEWEIRKEGKKRVRMRQK